MGIRLVYGLKTRDPGYLDIFFPSRRLAESAKKSSLDYNATIYDPDSPMESYIDFCFGHVAILRGELPGKLYVDLETAGIPVVNASGATLLAHDKLLTARFFDELGTPYPDTATIDRAQGMPPFPWPFVAKPRYGRMGWGVRLIGNEQDWTGLLSSSEYRNNEYLAQRYIETSRGTDIRFFFADFGHDKPPDDSRWEPRPVPQRAGLQYASIVRTSDGFASNAHAGGSMSAFEAPQALRFEAERIFLASGLDYGTVDFLVGDAAWKRFSVCELNANPGFEELERAGGLDVALAILSTALRRVGTGGVPGGSS